MSFFNDLSPVGKILCGAALVVAAPVAAAAAIPVCAAIGTVGIGLGASSSAVVSRASPPLARWKPLPPPSAPPWAVSA